MAVCCIYLHFLLWMGSLYVYMCVCVCVCVCVCIYIYIYIYLGGQGDIVLALIISCHLRHIFPLVLIVIYTYLENTEKHKEEKD